MMVKESGSRKGRIIFSASESKEDLYTVKIDDPHGLFTWNFDVACATFFGKFFKQATFSGKPPQFQGSFEEWWALVDLMADDFLYYADNAYGDNTKASEALERAFKMFTTYFTSFWD